MQLYMLHPLQDFHLSIFCLTASFNFYFPNPLPTLYSCFIVFMVTYLSIVIVSFSSVLIEAHLFLVRVSCVSQRYGGGRIAKCAAIGSVLVSRTAVFKSEGIDIFRSLRSSWVALKLTYWDGRKTSAGL